MKIKRFLILALPFAASAIIYFCMKLFLNIMDSVIYVCPVFLTTGLYCPGCGGTRAVKALLDGRIFESFIDNPSVLTCILIMTFLYAELVIKTFGKNIKIIPRSKTFWYVLSGIFIVYYIARNFLDVIMPR